MKVSRQLFDTIEGQFFFVNKGAEKLRRHEEAGRKCIRLALHKVPASEFGLRSMNFVLANKPSTMLRKMIVSEFVANREPCPCVIHTVNTARIVLRVVEEQEAFVIRMVLKLTVERMAKVSAD